MKKSKYVLPLFPQRVADGAMAAENIGPNGLPRASGKNLPSM